MKEEKFSSSCVYVDPSWGSTCRRIEKNAEYWQEVERLLNEEA